MNILNPIDKLLNAFTMYRVVLYGLIILSVSALALSLFGIVSFSPQYLLISALVLLLACYATNYTLSTLLKAPANVESVYITALILFLILAPASSFQDLGTLAIAGVLAMASKYIFAIHKKHVFNPAAIAAFILGLAGNGAAIWWVATPVLTIITAVIGILIVRKIRRFSLFFSFFIAALVSISFFGIVLQHQNIQELLMQVLASWPIIFFGTIMLTEPLTTPPTRNLQIQYGAIVGVLFGSQFHFGPIYSTPELALILGNIFSYIVSPKDRLILTLKAKNKLSPEIYEFVFTPDKPPHYEAGQYLEWTLPHKHPDGRGNRRYFTIASSPSESEIKLGIKIPAPSSSFKSQLAHLNVGDNLYASQLAGDFTLPQKSSKKLVFIAGGIGITPFRSMAQFLIDKKMKEDIVLIYLNSNADDFVYKDIFKKAENIGLKTVYVVTHAKDVPPKWSGKTGYLTKEMIEEVVSDYANRMYYLSGPNAMVEVYEKLILSLKIPSSNIVKDYFPGF